MIKDFLLVLANSQTRVMYDFAIHSLLKDPDEFVKIANSDKKKAENMLLKRIIERRGEIAATTLKMYFSCVRTFLDDEEVKLNWKKIRRAIPSSRSVGQDRPPSIQEIRSLLDVCDKRMRAIVLIMCSSGIRVGAFEFLSLKDYSKLDNGMGRLDVYRGELEQYVTYMTPEAVGYLDAYLDERKKAGEILKPDSPIIREALNYLKDSKNKPIRITVRSIGVSLYHSWVKSGLKESGQGRGEFKAAHGFRKYFKTRSERTMKSITVEILMGHSIGVSNSYYKPLEQDLIEDYQKSIPDLTISENEELKIQNSEMQNQLEEMIRSLSTRLDRIEIEGMKEKIKKYS